MGRRTSLALCPPAAAAIVLRSSAFRRRGRGRSGQEQPFQTNRFVAVARRRRVALDWMGH